MSFESDLETLMSLAKRLTVNIAMQKISSRIANLNSQFSGQISLTFVATILIQAAGMLTGILLARFLGPEKRGELAAIQLWGSFFATLALVGLPESVIFFGAKEKEKIGQFWSTGVFAALVLGSPIILLGYFILPFVPTCSNQSGYCNYPAPTQSSCF